MIILGQALELMRLKLIPDEQLVVEIEVPAETPALSPTHPPSLHFDDGTIWRSAVTGDHVARFTIPADEVSAAIGGNIDDRRVRLRSSDLPDSSTAWAEGEFEIVRAGAVSGTNPGSVQRIIVRNSVGGETITVPVFQFGSWTGVGAPTLSSVPDAEPFQSYVDTATGETWWLEPDDI